MYWRGKWQPTPVWLPVKSHGQRRLVGYIQSMGSQRVRHDLQLNNSIMCVCAYSLYVCVYIYVYIYNFI